MRTPQGGAGLDAQAVNEQFPLLVHGRAQRRPLAFLDNSSTTQKPNRVLAAQDYYYRYLNANPLRGVYRLGTESTRIYENARHAVARFLACDDGEVVFTGGATESLNLVASSFGAQTLNPGDEVVVSVSEHHSNLVPWQTTARLTGARLVYLVPDEEGRLSDREIDRVIGPKTKIVAIAHVSNVLGTVAPVARIARAAHDNGAVVVLDCAQSVAHLPVDVRALDVDFAAFSGHKMFAPMGIGVLYGRRALLEAMPPFMQGGGMVDHVFEQRTTFAEAPTRFEAGTPNVGGAVALAEAVQFMKELGYESIRVHEERLLRRMLAGLEALPDVTVYGEARMGSENAAAPPGDAATTCPTRCAVVSFNVHGTNAVDVAEALARDNVAIRAGAHCAEPLVRHLGVRATCRASLALYNTEADIDRLLESVERAKRTVSNMIIATMH